MLKFINNSSEVDHYDPVNRSRKYKESENEKTTLSSNKYQPSVKAESSHVESTIDTPSEAQKNKGTDE